MLGPHGQRLPAGSPPPPPFARAWQHPPARESFLHRGSQPPVDVVVQVSGHRFHAHSIVLSAHSGYLKNLLSDNATSAKEETASDYPPPEPSFLALSVPSLSSSLFAILLDFMYSSRLCLNLDNVTDVLLGARMLDMPRAVEACHSYLLRFQQHIAHQSLGLYPMPIFTSLPSNPDPIHSRFLYSASGTLQPQPPRYGPATPSHRIVRPIPTAGPPAFFSPILGQWNSSFKLAGSSAAQFQVEVAPEVPPRIWDYDTESKATAQLLLENGDERRIEDLDSVTEDGSLGSTRRPASAASTPLSVPRTSSTDEREAKVDDSNGEASRPASRTTPALASVQAVIDIACCDGPVKFQRVLNENCSLVIMMTATQEQAQRPRSGRERRREASSNSASGSSCAASISTSVNFHWPTKPSDGTIDSPAATRAANVSDTSPKTVEGRGAHDAKPNRADPLLDEASNRHPASSKGPTARPDNPIPSGFLYYCVHCKHSFKSRCCYLKHRWRHLNPMTLVARQHGGGTKQKKACKSSSTASTVPAEPIQVPKVAGNKKPLEINVPFYPCKQCGCKFPSYYFVHKHRKICHENRRHRREDTGDVSSSSLDATAGEDDVNLTDDDDDDVDDGEEPPGMV